ncbi:MAG: hypothetical protein KC419_14620 [Anaerolineales bacterium]|nr:hypothetical protein [Anaerolineales bacterium]MCA9929717.1 hypothetical protein [Anaerolineales bacterium]
MEALRKFWEGWKKFGQFMGDLIGRLVLTIFYFTILLPFGILVTLFSDRLDLKSFSTPKWLERKTTDLTMDDARRLS